MSVSFKLTFNKSIYKNIDTLYFIENNNNIYYDGTHMNYIYIHKVENIDYIFHGFFKDDYFVIIFDSYDNELSINIEIKYVIILKLKWISKEIKKQNIFVIDYDSMKNYKVDAYILKNRKKLNKILISKMEDYLRLYDYKIITAYINSNKKKNIIIDKIKNILNS